MLRPMSGGTFTATTSRTTVMFSIDPGVSNINVALPIDLKSSLPKRKDNFDCDNVVL